MRIFGDNKCRCRVGCADMWRVKWKFWLLIHMAGLNAQWEFWDSLLLQQSGKGFCMVCLWRGGLEGDFRLVEFKLDLSWRSRYTIEALSISADTTVCFGYKWKICVGGDLSVYQPKTVLNHLRCKAKYTELKAVALTAINNIPRHIERILIGNKKKPLFSMLE